MGTVEFYTKKASEAASLFTLHVIRGLAFEDAWRSTLDGQPVTHEMMKPFFDAYTKRSDELWHEEKEKNAD